MQAASYLLGSNYSKKNGIGYCCCIERVTINYSNLFSLDDYIKPELVLQLQAFKVHLYIKNFKSFIRF
jgi:hypothetical protein